MIENEASSVSNPPAPPDGNRSQGRGPLDRSVASIWNEDRNRLYRFLTATGGTLFYALSALSIVYGITQIIGPPLAKSSVLGDILPCVLVLNAYELALFAVFMTLVLWRNITGDAISLVALVGIFWIASAMTLGVVVPSGLDIGLAIGSTATVITILKLWAFRRYISLDIGSLTFLGMSIILAWNFVCPSLMIRPMASYVADDVMRREYWLYGWLIILAGVALIYLDAVKREYVQRRCSVVFLRSGAMIWVLALILMVGSLLHQYGIAYMFAVDTFAGDYLLVVSMVLLMVVELGRSLGMPIGLFQMVLACLPLVLTLLAVLNKATVGAASLTCEGLFYAPVTLGVVGLIVSGVGIWRKWPRIHYVAIAYGLVIELTAGRGHQLNVVLFGVSVIIILGLLGVLKRNVNLCFACVLLFTAALGSSDRFARFAACLGFGTIHALAAVVGLGTLAIAIGFGRNTPRKMILTGIIAVAYSVSKMPPPALNGIDLLICIALAILSVVLGLRTKAWGMGVLLWIPIGIRGYTLAIHLSSWCFVVLSFPLLFMGAGVSLYLKHRAGLVKGEGQM